MNAELCVLRFSQMHLKLAAATKESILESEAVINSGKGIPTKYYIR